MSRRILLTLLAGASVGLVPWIVYLSGSLPDEHATDQWRVAWVGFDIALAACFAASVWLGWRRHRAAVPLLAGTAALLCCDAWFDVLLCWNGPDRWVSVALAALVELPVAVVLVVRARILLVGGLNTRQLTVHDIEQVLAHPARQRLLGALDPHEPVTEKELAATLGVDRPAVEADLRALAEAGYARRTRRGWVDLPVDLREPRDIAPEQQASFDDWITAKLRHELELFGRAFRHATTLGPWGKGSRARMHLTEGELASFHAEYMDLMSRYSGLRRGPATGTRQIAVRYYAFPQAVAEDDYREPVRAEPTNAGSGSPRPGRPAPAR
ncbi:helix-turn-helix domain-containing protein [Longispora sp. K20-0274]|uniref:winged helix-turn-helix domain-containing protein n=1 Tax=Longispora sp. K20-0274 TaxID=3088255 RepID=UPI00399B612C